MLSEIAKYEAQGLRIGVYPTLNNKKHEWTACVRVGNNSRLSWVQGEEGCMMSCFKTSQAAFEAALKFCEEYKPNDKKSR